MRRLTAIGGMLLALVLFSCSSSTDSKNDLNALGELTESFGCKQFAGGSQLAATPPLR